MLLVPPPLQVLLLPSVLLPLPLRRVALLSLGRQRQQPPLAPLRLAASPQEQEPGPFRSTPQPLRPPAVKACLAAPTGRLLEGLSAASQAERGRAAAAAARP